MFWAEGSTQWPSAQYLRSIIRPNDHAGKHTKAKGAYCDAGPTRARGTGRAPPYLRAGETPAESEQQEELAHVIELELAELTGTERPYSKQASMRRPQKWSAADDRYR